MRKANPDQVRSIVFEVVTEVNRRGAYSNLLLPKILSESKLDERDKSFATELVYGTLRLQGKYDYLAAKASKKPWDDVDAGIQDITRIGAHQLFELRTPSHAAVSATVEVARKYLGESKASFVNAILRRLSEMNLDEELSGAPLSARFSHPEWIISAYRDHIKDEAELIQLLNCNNQAVRPTVVTWPSKATRDEISGVETKYSPYGVVADAAPNQITAIKERRAGVQDEGSQLVAIAFANSAKMQPWLDLCAGPGGKAALLSYLDPEPMFANEISEPRSELIRKVVKNGTTVWTGDGRELMDHQMKFGAILADVPCTGLGALRRRPEVRWRRQPSDLPALTKLQFELSSSAIHELKPGGIFGYATCSPHLAETTAQRIAILKRFPELEPIPVSLPNELLNGDGALSLWPHRHNTDAMYLALFQKKC